MQRLKAALESLDERISELEDKIERDATARFTEGKKHADAIKQSRVREANAIAVAQKVATRIDHTITRVEHILRD